MLKDELELITGKLIQGDVTHTVFDLLKSSEYFDLICKDVDRMRGGGAYVDNPVSSDDAVQNFGGGFDILRWLSETGESVSLPGDAPHSEGANKDKRDGG